MSSILDKKKTSGSSYTESNCHNFDSCFLCTVQEGCGWCDNKKGKCYDDTTTKCINANWRIHSDQCPESYCLVKGDSCRSCVGLSGCGWCEEKALCLKLEDESCNSTLEVNVFSCCGGSSINGSCDTCLNPNKSLIGVHHDCGWCEEDLRCIEDNSYGASSCKQFYADTCPVAPKPGHYHELISYMVLLGVLIIVVIGMIVISEYKRKKRNESELQRLRELFPHLLNNGNNNGSLDVNSIHTNEIDERTGLQQPKIEQTYGTAVE